MKTPPVTARCFCFTFALAAAACLISSPSICQSAELKIPETVPVAAGSFSMGMDVKFDAASGATQTWPTPDGYTGATKLKESPAHAVTMSAFSIGKYEVTNEEYAAFVEAGGYDNRDYWLIDEEEYAEAAETGWKWKEKNKIIAPSYSNYTTGAVEAWDLSKSPYWKDLTYSSEDTSPVVGVSWYEAYAYCKWLSAQTGETWRLPTEAEWEYAGRGPKSNIFPWGNDYLTTDEFCGPPGSGAMANCWQKEESANMAGPRYSGISTAMETGLEGDTVPVGSYPEGVSWCGAYDMAGNVMEWSADWFIILYYPRSISSGNINDPVGPDMGLPPFYIPIPPFWMAPCRTLRSIGFIQDPIGADNYSPHPTYPLRCSHRQFVKRYGGTFYIGFRVLKEN